MCHGSSYKPDPASDHLEKPWAVRVQRGAPVKTSARILCARQTAFSHVKSWVCWRNLSTAALSLLRQKAPSASAWQRAGSALTWFALWGKVVGCFHSATRCALGIPQTRRGIRRSLLVEALWEKGVGFGVPICRAPVGVLQGRVGVMV